jgi:hypothetical protein
MNEAPWPQSRASAQLFGKAVSKKDAATPQNEVDQIAAAMENPNCRTKPRASEIQHPPLRPVPSPHVNNPGLVDLVPGLVDMSSQTVIKRLLDQGYTVVESKPHQTRLKEQKWAPPLR